NLPRSEAPAPAPPDAPALPPDLVRGAAPADTSCGPVRENDRSHKGRPSPSGRAHRADQVPAHAEGGLARKANRPPHADTSPTPPGRKPILGSYPPNPSPAKPF